jgi:hypothetical protein
VANKENVRKWVDALRSGKYGQTQGFLRRDDRFCCLGVACEVAMENGVAVSAFPRDDSYGGNGVWAYGGEGLVALPPWSVVEWLGLDEENPKLTDEGRHAAELNDEDDWTFEQIADAIEKKFLTPEVANA